MTPDISSQNRWRQLDRVKPREGFSPGISGLRKSAFGNLGVGLGSRLVMTLNMPVDGPKSFEIRFDTRTVRAEMNTGSLKKCSRYSMKGSRGMMNGKMSNNFSSERWPRDACPGDWGVCWTKWAC